MFYTKEKKEMRRYRIFFLKGGYTEVDNLQNVVKYLENDEVLQILVLL